MQNIKIYNPRDVMRSGAKAMLTDAVNPENLVLFRAGKVKVKGQASIVGAHGVAEKTFGPEVMGAVFKLVQLTPEEVRALQKQLNNQYDQEGPKPE